MTEIQIQQSTENIFEDLGFTNSAEMLVKAELAHKISNIIHHRHLSQTQAAQVLGIDQPKISALTRGELSGFSIERLFKFLTLLGKNIQISIKPKQRRQHIGKVNIIAA